MHQGQCEEAEKLLVQVMGMAKEIGNEHPRTFNGMHNLASVYLEQKRCQEALDLGFQVMTMRRGF